MCGLALGRICITTQAQCQAFRSYDDEISSVMSSNYPLAAAGHNQGTMVMMDTTTPVILCNCCEAHVDPRQIWYSHCFLCAVQHSTQRFMDVVFVILATELTAEVFAL